MIDLIDVHQLPADTLKEVSTWVHAVVASMESERKVNESSKVSFKEFEKRINDQIKFYENYPDLFDLVKQIVNSEDEKRMALFRAMILEETSLEETLMMLEKNIDLLNFFSPVIEKSLKNFIKEYQNLKTVLPKLLAKLDPLNDVELGFVNPLADRFSKAVREVDAKQAQLSLQERYKKFQNKDKGKRTEVFVELLKVSNSNLWQKRPEKSMIKETESPKNNSAQQKRMN